MNGYGQKCKQEKANKSYKCSFCKMKLITSCRGEIYMQAETIVSAAAPPPLLTGRSKPGLGKQEYNGCNVSRMFWMRACVIACVRWYWWICQVSGQGVMWLLTGSQQACWELQQSVCPPCSTPTPSLDSPLLSQSSAPHICCVLATDSKLQPPGPLPDSIPISSRVPLLPPSPQRAINSPSLHTSVCLPPFLSLFLSLRLSYSPWLFNSFNPCQTSLLFPVFLSLLL